MGHSRPRHSSLLSQSRKNFTHQTMEDCYKEKPWWWGALAEWKYSHDVLAQTRLGFSFCNENLIAIYSEIVLFKQSPIKQVISKVKNILRRNYLIAKSTFADLSTLPHPFKVVICSIFLHSSVTNFKKIYSSFKHKISSALLNGRKCAADPQLA